MIDEKQWVRAEVFYFISIYLRLHFPPLIGFPKWPGWHISHLAPRVLFQQGCSQTFVPLTHRWCPLHWQARNRNNKKINFLFRFRKNYHFRNNDFTWAWGEIPEIARTSMFTTRVRAHITPRHTWAFACASSIVTPAAGGVVAAFSAAHIISAGRFT